MATPSACAGFLTGYMRATEEKNVATFGWNAFEREKLGYQRRMGQGTAGKCMWDMTMTGKLVVPASLVLVSGIMLMMIVSYKILSTCLILQVGKSMGKYCKVLREDGHAFPNWFLHLGFFGRRSAEDLLCKRDKPLRYLESRHERVPCLERLGAQ